MSILLASAAMTFAMNGALTGSWATPYRWPAVAIAPPASEVRANDTLVGIAKKFGTTVPAIKLVNDLTSNTIHTGQKLKIP